MSAHIQCLRVQMPGIRGLHLFHDFSCFLLSALIANCTAQVPLQVAPPPPPPPQFGHELWACATAVVPIADLRNFCRVFKPQRPTLNAGPGA